AASVVADLVARLGAEVADAEVVALVVGGAAPGAEGSAAVAALAGGFPHLHVDVIPGGQRTRYLVGGEGWRDRRRACPRQPHPRDRSARREQKGRPGKG